MHFAARPLVMTMLSLVEGEGGGGFALSEFLPGKLEKKLFL